MRAIIPAIALALAGCTKYVPIQLDLPKPELARACKVGSEPWVELETGQKSEIGKKWVENRQQYRQLRNRHAVCRRFAAQQVK